MKINTALLSAWRDAERRASEAERAIIDSAACATRSHQLPSAEQIALARELRLNALALMREVVIELQRAAGQAAGTATQEIRRVEWQGGQGDGSAA